MRARAGRADGEAQRASRGAETRGARFVRELADQVLPQSVEVGEVFAARAAPRVVPRVVRLGDVRGELLGGLESLVAVRTRGLRRELGLLRPARRRRSGR